MTIRAQVQAFAGCPIAARQWHHWLEHMLHQAVPDMLAQGSLTLDVQLTLVRDEESAQINKAGLLLPGPTNILSFPAQDGDANLCAARVSLGELYLSWDTLVREAFLYGQHIEEHACRLLAHGLAHLLGYDHGDDMDDMCARLLEGIEVRAFSSS